MSNPDDYKLRLDEYKLALDEYKLQLDQYKLQLDELNRLQMAVDEADEALIED